MKKKIADPTRPEGHYYGYDSAADCLADYDAELRSNHSSDFEGLVGYICLWVFLAVVVLLSIIAGLAKW